jgi:hypothetical protein
MELTPEQIAVVREHLANEIMHIPTEQLNNLPYINIRLDTGLPPLPEPQTPTIADIFRNVWVSRSPESIDRSAYNMPYDSSPLRDNSPLEDNSPELIAWLNGPEGTEWTKNNHVRIVHHALLEDHDDIPPGHNYGGSPRYRYDQNSNTRDACACMTTEDGIPEEVTTAHGGSYTDVTDELTGETTTYFRYNAFDNSLWEMRTPEGNPSIAWGYNPDNSQAYVKENRDTVF